jgi:hypothetical protein
MSGESEYQSQSLLTITSMEGDLIVNIVVNAFKYINFSIPWPVRSALEQAILRLAR